jgi:formylmethanofuran dehydrogenase subunit E|tara:strand:+ start:232 stop:438 length:207 start_codon:yes stop_codon:yes gene_type:complete
MRDMTHPTDKASTEFISQVVAESKITNRQCDLCKEETWDIYEELSDTHMCGLCYTYIWKRDIAKHIKQ